MSGNDNTDHHEGVLLEDINHKFDVIVEYLAPLTHLPRKVDQMDTRLQRVEADVKVIKRVVTDQSSQLTNHEKRITKIEQAA